MSRSWLRRRGVRSGLDVVRMLALALAACSAGLGLRG
jgi:isopentenyl diphosphate isomerase/L-lactate dehydrogenase-like FMN-dependent dehydrogenase